MHIVVPSHRIWFVGFVPHLRKALGMGAVVIPPPIWIAFTLHRYQRHLKMCLLSISVIIFLSQYHWEKHSLRMWWISQDHELQFITLLVNPREMCGLIMGNIWNISITYVNIKTCLPNWQEGKFLLTHWHTLLAVGRLPILMVLAAFAAVISHWIKFKIFDNWCILCDRFGILILEYFK